MIKTSNLTLILKRAAFNNPSREGKFFQKIVNKSLNRDNKRADRKPVLAKATSLAKGSFEGLKSTHFQRANALNKIFMQSITEIMANGEHSSEFIGKGIIISRVQIAPNFGGINVFWITNGTEADDVTESTLQKYSTYLRCELTAIKVIGFVPKIYFVKDKQYSLLSEIDTILMKADYGEDYEPTFSRNALKSNFKLCSESNRTETVNKVSKKDLSNPASLDEGNKSLPLPLMRQDLFGLNHSEILARNLKAIKKSRAAHRQDDSIKPTNMETNSSPFQYESNKQERDAFNQFIKSRKVAKKRLHRTKTRFEEGDNEPSSLNECLDENGTDFDYLENED